jgi:hypothetical protein
MRIEMTDSTAIQTATMAEIYAEQGHWREAAQIYRRLLETVPENDDWQQQLAALEQKHSAEDTVKDLRGKVAQLMSTWIQLQMRYAALQRVKDFTIDKKVI